MTFTEPCLAASLLEPDIEHNDANVLDAMRKLRYPVMVTVKKDGVRGLRLNGTLLSRRLKKIPNLKIRDGSLILHGGFDMELWTPELEYNDIQSIVMSFEHHQWLKIHYHILDCYYPQHSSMSYEERCYNIIGTVAGVIETNENCRIHFEVPTVCNSSEELFEFEKKAIEFHGEGICFRTPVSPYKFGRSTLNEQYLVKLSRYSRDEAVIIGVKEQMENGNPSNYNLTGKMDRSKSLFGLTGKGTLGSLIVKNTSGQIFTIGTGVGLTNKFRQEIWDNQPKYLGRTITYKCKLHGKKVLPRSPIMVGWRKDGE